MRHKNHGITLQIRTQLNHFATLDGSWIFRILYFFLQPGQSLAPKHSSTGSRKAHVKASALLMIMSLLKAAALRLKKSVLKTY